MYNRQNNEFIEDDEGEEAAAKKTVFNNARHMENFPCIARHALAAAAAAAAAAAKCITKKNVSRLAAEKNCNSQRRKCHVIN